VVQDPPEGGFVIQQSVTDAATVEATKRLAVRRLQLVSEATSTSSAGS
jgi:hypothetical protein